MYRNYFNNGAMTPSATDARLVVRLDEIRDSFLLEAARWGYVSPATWESNAAAIRANLFPYRPGELIAQWRNFGWFPSFDPPTLNQFGGQVDSGFEVTLSTPVGSIYYTLDGSDPRLPGGGVSSNALLYSSSSSLEEMYIPAGSIWKYLDDGSNQATAWRESGFIDSAWSSGAAELGYGDGQVTELSYGPDAANKYTTSYYRHTFEVENASTVTSLELELLRDDGAVVYLNGTEILRNNMPDGTVVFDTFASIAVGGDSESTFYSFTLPADLLQEGSNVIAVEIHQINLTSSDLSFNLSLTGTSEGVVTPEDKILLEEDTTVLSRVLYGSDWAALSDAHFIVGDRVEPTVDNILISEINYNPDGSDDYEFIEIYLRFIV